MKGILKNGKRAEIHEQVFEDTVWDRLPGFPEIGPGFDGGEKVVKSTTDNVFIQPHARAIGAVDGSARQIGPEGQIPQNVWGLQLLMIPITLILFRKTLVHESAKRGNRTRRLHARQWKEAAI